MNPLRISVIRSYGSYLVGFGILIVFYLFSLYHFLLFHTIAELFSIVVAGSVFILVWNARGMINQGYLTLLGVAMLSVATLDLFHTLSYPGLTLTEALGFDVSGNFWLAARLVQAVSMLLALRYLDRPLRMARVVPIIGGVTLLALALIIVWPVIPVSYVGTQQTPFKIAGEMTAVVILAAALALLARRREAFDRRVFRYLVLALVFSITTEVTIIVSQGGDNFMRVTAHTFKIGAFYSIYKAVIETSIKQPLHLLFRDLKQREAELQRSTIQLARVFESLTDAVYVLDQDGTIVRANPQGIAMFGYDPTGVSRENVLARKHMQTPQGEPVAAGGLPSSRALTGERVVNEPYRVINQQGRTYDILASAAPLLQGGRVVGAVTVWHDLTEIQQAQDRLNRQQQQTADILESIDDSLIALDGEARILYINSAAAANAPSVQTGEPAAGLVGKTIWEVYPHLLGTEAEAIYRQVMETRRPFRGEYQSRASGRWYHIHVYPSAEGITVYSVDISHAKQIELALQAASARERARAAELEALMDVVPVAVMIAHDPHCQVVSANQAAYRLHRMEVGENLTATPGDSRPPDHFRTFEGGRELQPHELPMQRAAAQGVEVRDIHNEIVFDDGTVRHLYGNVHPLLNEEGRPRGAIGAFMDVSELVQTQAALRESETRFQALVESMQDIIFTLDQQGRFTGVFGRWLTAYGLQPDFFLGRSVLEALGPEAARVHDEANRRALAGETVVYEWTSPQAFGVIYYQTRLSPVYDEQGRVTELVGVGRDITALKRAEKAQADYAARLEDSNRDLEQFAFVASHDLQEPLRKIRAFADRVRAQAGSALGETERDYLERMVRATRRMQEMIAGLLSYSRVTTQGRPFRPVDLDSLVDEVILDLEQQIEESGGRVARGPLPTVAADALQIRQLFQNLISNGLKFHREGAAPVVEISTHPVSAHTDQAAGGPAAGAEEAGVPGAEGEFVEILVRDNGIGFDMANLERIFRPFERLHGRSEFEGTGMGLAICRKIVERHNGSITAHSTPGAGTTFIIRMPLRAQENAEPDAGDKAGDKAGHEADHEVGGDAGQDQPVERQVGEVGEGGGDQ